MSDLYKSTSRQIVLMNILSVLRQTLVSVAMKRFSFKELIRQIYEFTVGSLSIVLICVSFVGVIIILEYSFHMKIIIGDDALIPSFAMVMLCRELAPTITALLITSKMGAAMAAELGAMKISEQLDAYRLLNLSPINLFVAPRFLASALSTLALSFLALGVAIFAGWITSITLLSFSTGTYFMNLTAFTQVPDLLLCGLKAFCFGASIPIISATFGFRCQFGAEGVGVTTTDAVVYNSIWIIILDFMLTFAWSSLLS